MQLPTLSVLVSGLLLLAPAGTQDPAAAPPLGTWRGTSTCTDLKAAPACHDEVVVYEFTAGDKPGVVHWKADKVVNGERLPMGEFDIAYDAADKCWKGEYEGPRSHTVWCLTVDGAHMTGRGWHLPGKETIRKIDVKKD